MTRSGTAGSGRLLGRGLLTLANVITVAAPIPRTGMTHTSSTSAGPDMPASTA